MRAQNVLVRHAACCLAHNLLNQSLRDVFPLHRHVHVRRDPVAILNIFCSYRAYKGRIDKRVKNATVTRPSPRGSESIVALPPNVDSFSREVHRAAGLWNTLLAKTHSDLSQLASFRNRRFVEFSPNGSTGAIGVCTASPNTNIKMTFLQLKFLSNVACGESF